MSLRRFFAVGVLFVLVFSLFQPKNAEAAQQAAGVVERVSVGSAGAGGGTYASLSADGRFVAFESSAADLVSGHLSDSWDTYLRDRQAELTVRASTRSDGTAVYNVGDYTSPPRTAGDGTYVVFVSRAEDLASNDHNGMPDVFVHNNKTGQTRLVSVSVNGSSGNADSYNPTITPDGRYVAFESYASNLVSGDTNNSVDIFVRDMVQNKTERISVNSQGQQGNDWHDIGGYSNVAISDNGQFVVFSYANLPGFTTDGVFLRDRANKTTQMIADGGYPNISANGEFIGFVSSAALAPDDANTEPDVYLYIRASQTFERISIASNGSEVSGQIINNAPGISADGSKVVFESSAPGLVSGDTNGLSDVFLRDRTASATVLISHTSGGAPGNDQSYAPAISADGSTIAFTSMASNLVSGDGNQKADVFVYNINPSSPVTVGPLKVFLPVTVR